MSAAKTAKSEGLVYKGHPLRRKDDLIYFGSMADPYIIQMQVLGTRKEKDLDVATRVSVQLQTTASGARSRVEKKTEKENLYAAMDVATVWLERALSSKE